MKHDEKEYGATEIKFIPGRPMQITKKEQKLPEGVSDEQKTLVRAVVSTIKAYIEAAKKLLDGKLSNIRDYAPMHLRNAGMVYAFCCQDGIIIRYDAKTDGQELRVNAGLTDETLSDWAPKISESVVYCHYNRDFKSTIPQKGPEIRLYKVDSTTGQETTLINAKIRYNVIIERPIELLPPPPRKPYCLLSVRNDLEIGLEGELVPDGFTLGQGKRFVLRTPIRLPVGWECIEVFPFVDLAYWKPEFAATWAENDLLASVVAHKLREEKFNTLDPNAAARKKFSTLLAAYEQLLDLDPEMEEELQVFLKGNPVLLCPANVKMWPKLTLGDHKTDFVFQEALGDYLLVELKKSTDRLFLKNGDESRELRHALGQIVNWKRYLEDNLSTVQRELGLTGISPNPRSTIIIGRSQSLSAENKRRLTTIHNISPKTSILTYDDLLLSTKAIVENLLGPLWGELGNTEIYYLPTT